jgi:hypothetical protein
LDEADRALYRAKTMAEIVMRSQCIGCRARRSNCLMQEVQTRHCPADACLLALVYKWRERFAFIMV